MTRENEETNYGFPRGRTPVDRLEERGYAKCPHCGHWSPSRALLAVHIVRRCFGWILGRPV
jgi:hypothetical protein